MNAISGLSEPVMEKRLPIILAVSVVAVVFLLTAIAIHKSRSDSYDLLEQQGIAFTEALAQASSNAITSESFYDFLIQKRYSDLVASITDRDLDMIDEHDLLRIAQNHGLDGLYIYDSSQALMGATSRAAQTTLPEFVENEIAQLFENPDLRFVLLTEQDENRISTTHYYLEKTSRLDKVVILACEALYYTEAVDQTGIGFLAQNMAREKGVEYIIYQSTEGIIFASRRPGDILAIESDPFLSEALESDSIVSRRYEFQGRTVLELVRPFSTSRFPFGLFRVGLSLQGYYGVARGLLVQMVVLAGVLVCLILLLILYQNSLRKRKELSRKYTRIKSVTDRIFEQMRTGVAVVNAQGDLSLANEAFENILGLSETVGEPWSEITPIDQLSLDDFLSGDMHADEKECTLTVKGEEKILLVARSKLTEEGSDNRAVVIVLYDITRIKEFEETSARRRRLSEMGDLAAGVAHEIRNPLNSISIAAQRLASEFVPQENRSEYCSFTDKIRSETARLNEIITRFLALTREERKSRSIIRVDEFLHDVGNLLRVEAEQSNIELTVEASSELSIEADPDRLKQVFQNLFNNAKEALRGEAGNIAVVAEGDGATVRVTFSDSGPGISSDLREKVFTPYFTTKEAGTGLGLPTVHRIVTDFGGEVVITDSARGETCVVMTFPIAQKK